MECGFRVAQTFSDSSICKKISCGRTKASAIAQNVLSPFSIEKHLEYIRNPIKRYSIASDSSNKGNIKYFLLE